jgi:hypothetical protein
VGSSQGIVNAERVLLPALTVKRSCREVFVNRDSLGITAEKVRNGYSRFQRQRLNPARTRYLQYHIVSTLFHLRHALHQAHKQETHTSLSGSSLSSSRRRGQSIQAVALSRRPHGVRQHTIVSDGQRYDTRSRRVVVQEVRCGLGLRCRASRSRSEQWEREGREGQRGYEVHCEFWVKIDLRSCQLRLLCLAMSRRVRDGKRK